MTYNVFGGTLNLAQLIAVCLVLTSKLYCLVTEHMHCVNQLLRVVMRYWKGWDSGVEFRMS